MKLLKKIRWAMTQSKLEENLRRYCAIEYRPADQSWALCAAMQKHKSAYFGDK